MTTRVNPKNQGHRLTRTKRRAEDVRILRLRKRMQLTQEIFSRVVGVKVRTLSKLEKGEEPSDQVKRNVTETERLQKALEEVVLKDTIAGWLEEPNDAFDGLKPIEVIERGQIDRLWAMIYDLRSGSPV